MTLTKHDLTEERVSMLHSLLGDATKRVGEQRLTINRQSDALEKIAGEAPAKKPFDGPSIGWPPGWSEDLRDTVNDMILEAYNAGHTRACWEMGQIADAALQKVGGDE